MRQLLTTAGGVLWVLAAVLMTADASAATRPPAVIFTTVPSVTTIDHFAIFEFAATDALSFECSVDGGVYAACTSPYTILEIAIGAHTFDVRAIAADGTGAATRHSWTIESVFDSPPSSLVHHGFLPPDDPNGGSFRVKCEFGHMKYDDAIVRPNQPGQSHLHMFLGNMLSDANSTIDSMVTTGNSTCNGGTLNRSSYWVPALIAPVFDESGDPIMGSDGNQVHEYVMPNGDGFSPDIYYKAAVNDVSVIQPMPHGLRMISGNAGASSGQDLNIIRWSCESWVITSGDDFSPSVPRCAVGDKVLLSVAFPSCWDGVTLYSADQSHMAYSEAQWTGTIWDIVCPASHPVALTQVSYNFAWDVTAAQAPSGDSRYWRLTSDMYTVDDANPGGFSAHGDWFMAWHPEVMDEWITNCIHGRKHCAGGDLGNGWYLEGLQTGTQEMPPIINLGMGPYNPTTTAIVLDDVSAEATPTALIWLAALAVLTAVNLIPSLRVLTQRCD